MDWLSEPTPESRFKEIYKVRSLKQRIPYEESTVDERKKKDRINNLEH